MSMLGGAGGATAPPTAEQQMEAGIKAELSKNLGLNLGGSLLGFSFDFILFGVMLHQILLWSSNFRTEKPFVKVVVIWSGLVATGTTAYSLYFLWDSFVMRFGNFSQFLKVRPLAPYGVLDVATIFPIHLFYLERAYRLNKERIWIPIAILPCIVCSAVAGIGLTVVANTLKSALEGGKLEIWFYLFFVSSAVADTSLTVLIAYGLSQAKTGWSRTDKLVSRLIRMSFETQLPGTLFIITALIYYALHHTSLFNAFFQFLFGKLYMVPFMAALNYRFTLRKAIGASGSDSSGNHRRTNTFNISNRHQQETMQVGALDQIKVDTVVYQESHVSPELRVGINRQRLPDEESLHSSHFAKEYEPDDFSSSTRLTKQPSLPSLDK